MEVEYHACSGNRIDDKLEKVECFADLISIKGQEDSRNQGNSQSPG